MLAKAFLDLVYCVCGGVGVEIVLKSDPVIITQSHSLFLHEPHPCFRPYQEETHTKEFIQPKISVE